MNKIVLFLFVWIVLALPTTGHSNVCGHWHEDTHLSHMATACTESTAKDLYDLLRTELGNAQDNRDYERQNVMALESLRLIVNVEGKFQGKELFKNVKHAIPKLLRLSGQTTDSEKMHIQYRAAQYLNRQNAFRPLLEKAQDLEFPWAFYEYASRYLTMYPEKADASLDKAIELGFEVPSSYYERKKKRDEALDEKARLALEKAQNEQQQAQIRQEKAEQLAQLDVPSIGVSSLNDALHRHTMAVARTADAGIRGSLGLGPNIVYNCDKNMCFAMAGIVEFRFVVLEISSCRYPHKLLATCSFEYKLESGTTVDMGNHPGNQFLQSLYDANTLTAQADLTFNDNQWKIIAMVN